MRFKVIRCVASAVATIFLVGACTAESSSRFVGDWKRIGFPKQSVSIVSEGSSRIALTGKPWPAGTMMGKVVDDKAIFDQFSTASLRNDGTLVFAGREFKRDR